MRTISPQTTRSLRRSGVVLLLAFTAACSREELLAVNTPDQITPEAAGNPSGAAALRVSALGNFANFYSGDNAGGGIGLNIAAGLLSDEMTTHRGGTEHMDSRAVNENTFPTTFWSLVGTASTQLIRARKGLEQFATPGATKQSQMAQMQTLEGYVYLLTGETYCNGVPISNADDANPKSENLSNVQLFNRAIAAFDSALALAPASDANIRNLATIGKARARLDLKEFATAAALVTNIPVTYQYLVQHSRTTIINDVYDWMVGTRNFGVVNREGGNGLDYLSANDPRIQFNPTPAPGQDGSLTISPTKFPQPDSPVILADGIEALMIRAEAALEAGDVTNFISLLNTARASRTGLAPLTDPGSTTARVDMLFRERAFWFWLTAHRLGDMRRLVRQYGRGAETVFPTGPYFKGGVYGTDVNLIPSNAERNNPNYQGCTNRNA
jgi:starch-binding outer membrane protein, SusD/RagB family